MPGGVGTMHLPAAAMIHLASRSPRRRLLLDQIGVDYAIVDAPIDETRRAGEPPERFVERMACEKALAGLAALGDARAAPVLAADTVVVLEEQVLGKPRDEEHAIAMLRVLSGRMHRVISAVAVAGIHVGDTGIGERRDAARDGGLAGAGAEDAGTGQVPDAAGNIEVASAHARDTASERGGDEASRTAIGTATGDAPRVVTSVSQVWFREIPYEERRAYCASGEPMDKAGAYAIQGRAAVFVARLDGSFSGVMGLPLFETASLLRETGICIIGREAEVTEPRSGRAAELRPGPPGSGRRRA